MSAVDVEPVVAPNTDTHVSEEGVTNQPISAEPKGVDASPREKDEEKVFGVEKKQVSFWRQFLALQKKNFYQKRRTPIGCFCELILPILFIVGLVGAWSAVDMSIRPMAHYVLPDDTTDDFGMVARMMLCNNGSTPVTGIFPCADPHDPLLYCAEPGLLPVESLCVHNYTAVDSLVRFMTFLWTNSRRVPSLDDMIAIRWLGRLIIGEYFAGSPMTYLQPDNSLAFGSYLHFVNDSNGVIPRIVEHWNATYPLFRHVFGGIHPNEKVAVDRLLSEEEYYGEVWALIALNEMTDTKLNVELRFNRTAIPWTAFNRDYYEVGIGSGFFRNYWAGGFSTLEVEMQDYYLVHYHNLTSNPTPPLNLAVMPIAAHRDSIFLIIAGGLCPLVLVLAYLYSVSQLVKRMVEEKEKRLREGMMIMGLHKAGFYMSWMVTYTSQMVVSSCIITAILKGTILQQSDASVVFVLFLLFSFSTVTFAAFLSSLFGKARTAAVVSPLLFFATSIPTFMLEPQRTPGHTYLALSFLPANAFGVGTRLVFLYERTRGMGWGDAWSESDSMKLGEAVIWLAADVILYFLLAVYFDAVLPSEWGTRQHPLWCLLFWRKPKPNPHEVITPLTQEADLTANSLREVIPRPTGQQPSVRMRHLSKVFHVAGEERKAVDDLSVDIYPGEVTVLLGHNGAGKTTAINILTGMLPVTAGNSEVYGKSILHEMASIRVDIGFCPQHNILWDDLTVREHLQFYAAIKGEDTKATERNANNLIETCGLSQFADTLAGNLSGGNKRKLSIAIAFVGGSRLIFLDEPTAGMDVVARRHTWELIRCMTPGRTIVLTTHFLDEADLLGHHIAIMNQGSVFCSGTSMFLKSKLGVGYSLNIAILPTVDTDELFDLIKSRIPSAETLSAKGGELSVRLPMDAVDSFPSVLQLLEDEGPSLGVRSFGISITTLEEVFLRISGRRKGEETTPISASPGAARGDTDEESSPRAVPEAVATVPPPDYDRLWPEGCDPSCEISPRRQFVSLLKKRFHNSKRDRRTQCYQIVTPVLVILIAMWLGEWQPDATPPKILDTSMYKESLLELPDYDCGEMYYEGNFLLNHLPNGSTPSAYNFSQWLLDTYDYHSLTRDMGFHCGGTHGTTLFVNASAHHGVGIGTALYGQSSARRALSQPDLQIDFVHHLLPFTPREAAFLDSFLSIMVGFFILIPFTFVPSTFVSFVVKEKEARAKHLQLVSGVHYISYWLSNFLFDFVSFLLVMVLVIFVLLIFGRDEYIGDGEVFGAFFLLFVLYGVSSIAGSYLSSFAFKSHGSASNAVMLISFIAGFLLVMLFYILSIIESTKDAAKVLKFFGRLMPSYCLGEGIIGLATLPLLKVMKRADSAFSMDVTGWSMVFMSIEFPVFYFLTLLLDHPSRELRRQQLLHNPDVVPPTPSDEDPDVAEERRVVESGERPSDLVSMRHLCKRYHQLGEPDVVAVKNLSFGVMKGEIFAFLGTNGAGKTTTMSIMTGEHLPTHGHGFVAGFDVVRDRAEARKRMGFCPQFDALSELLSPMEHLELYASLRGVNPASTPIVVGHLLDICDLTLYKNIPAHQLSGGNKRKLSLAIALIGSPKVLFLDEPSAGMDPKSRRQLWSVIQRASTECSVVITTHHLEEIEVLGDRVAIMVAGELKCIGPLQVLKSKYGSGFEMMVKVRGQDDLPQIHNFISETFPNATLSEEKQTRVTYELPRENTKLSAVFQVLGENKERCCITDYSLTQTSLEQVFLRISEAAHDAGVLLESEVGQHN